MVLEAKRRDDLISKLRILLLADLNGQEAINFERELSALYNKYRKDS